MKHVITWFVAVASLLFAALSFATPPDIPMVMVKGGCYQKGDHFVAGDNIKPTADVCVKDFWIGKYEITQAEWKAVMGNNPGTVVGDKLPVDSVSWAGVHEFISKLNSKTGRHYRLPTTSEWEYAARSGGNKERWSGTNDPKLVADYAWTSENSGGKPHEVGTRKPNSLGIYDMSGNVAEWCLDKAEYANSERSNPQGSEKRSFSIFRGGSWNVSSGGARVFLNMGSVDSHHKDTDDGFRLALDGD